MMMYEDGLVDMATVPLPLATVDNLTTTEEIPWRITYFTRFGWGDFEALSYCWGSEQRDRRIILNEQPVLVPTNLEAALQVLRHHHDTEQGLRLWIDFLCIDQNNLLEKNEQVKHMRNTYSEALAVLVWLGCEANNSNGAVKLLFSMAIQKMLLETSAIEQSWCWTAPWIALQSFLSRAYWQRLWIIQELASNHDMTLFLCGREQISRSIILAALDFCRDHIETINTALIELVTPCPEKGSVVDIWDVVYQVQNLLQLEDNTSRQVIIEVVLNLCRRAKCLNPRDKIYGILGLLPQSISAQIWPDYELSKQEVYRKFAAVLLETSAHSLHTVLAWCIYHEDNPMPTWIPDWTTPFPRNHIRWLRTWRASLTSSANCTILPNTQYLRCRGFLIDTLENVGAAPSECSPYHITVPSESNRPMTYPLSSRYGGMTELTAALRRTLLMNIRFQASGNTLMDIYWVDKHILSGKGPHHTYSFWKHGMRNIIPSPSWDSFDVFRQANADFLVSGVPFRDFFPPMSSYETPTLDPHFSEAWPPPSLDDRATHDMRLCVLALVGRRLMTTLTGYIGLVPEAAQPGDVVAILHGCNFPVILRSRGETYAMIGEAYVDGIMEGEAMDAQERGEYTLEDLVIS